MVSRVIAKRFTADLRHDALRHLADIGMVTSKLERTLHEDVLPWLFERVDDFLLDDAVKIKNTFEMIEHGIRASQYSHH